MASSKIRLLFDELLPHRVAKALRVLGFNTSHVGAEADGAPARGSSDEIVLAHAKNTGQVIVTSNHDMLLLCAEAGESVVWIDPRGRQYQRAELVVLCFQGIETWESLLRESTEPTCVRARRTKTEAIQPSEAARLARQRMKRLQARQRQRPARAHVERSPRLPDLSDGPAL